MIYRNGKNTDNQWRSDPTGSSILYSPSGFFPSYYINEVNFWHYKKYGSVGRFTVFGTPDIFSWKSP
jgi:hypothetical protein